MANSMFDGDLSVEHIGKLKTPRGELLMEAFDITHKDRNANYGSPEDNFGKIAGLWNEYWGSQSRGFVSHDVAIMMILVKIARLAVNKNHHDSAVDIAGYAACLADIQELSKDNNAGSHSTAI